MLWYVLCGSRFLYFGFVLCWGTLCCLLASWNVFVSVVICRLIVLVFVSILCRGNRLLLCRFSCVNVMLGTFGLPIYFEIRYDCVCCAG